jgi:hypothetical protein
VSEQRCGMNICVGYVIVHDEGTGDDTPCKEACSCLRLIMNLNRAECLV